MSLVRRNRLGAMPIARAAIAALAGGALLAGCASNGNPNTAGSGGKTDPSTVGIVGEQADGGAPVDGGTLSFASYSPVASLDPTKTQPAGTTGGTEMAAVYDVLLRYDAETETYHPQLAKELTESEDHLTWTLKLREGVTFSDGAPLNADAVVASTNRFNEKRGPNNEVFQAGVESVEAIDEHTVVYTLKQPWTEFAAMLTFGHGMIVGAASDGADGTFTPIGAGPFTMESLVPGELSLKARADYWDGKPHLDGLKFVTIKDEQPKIDALATGGIQMAFLRNAATVNSAQEQFPGYIETLSMADLGQINSREGRPGADVRLRRAMQLATDPEVLNQRSKDGQGMPGTALFQEWSKWHNDAPAATLNLEEATALVNEAKADGFDGRLTYVSVQDQSSQQQALAVQSMLAAVGFDVTIDYAPTVTDMVKKLYVDHDFDIGYGALSISDAAPFLRFYSALNSTSSNNVGGYQDAGLDVLLANVQAATDDDAKRAAIADLQVEINKQVPLLAYGAGPNFVAWTDNVHGVVPTMDSMMLFGKAWLS